MATKNIPAREVRCCDVCGRADCYQTKCIACGRDYCLTCEAVFPGCVVGPDVCRKCELGDAVQALCDEFAPALAAVVAERDAKIKALNPRPQE